MKFLIGEGDLRWLEWAQYRGAVGLFYEDTLGGVLTYLVFGLVCILSAIGLYVVLKTILFGFPTKKKK